MADLAVGRAPGARGQDAAIHQGEAERLTLGQTREARLLDRRDVHEHVLAAVVAALRAEYGDPRDHWYLEQSAGDDDRTLTRLICDEADRIVKLVDRMEVFSDERPVEREPVRGTYRGREIVERGPGLRAAEEGEGDGQRPRHPLRPRSRQRPPTSQSTPAESHSPRA